MMESIKSNSPFQDVADGEMEIESIRPKVGPSVFEITTRRIQHGVGSKTSSSIQKHGIENMSLQTPSEKMKKYDDRNFSAFSASPDSSKGSSSEFDYDSPEVLRRASSDEFEKPQKSSMNYIAKSSQAYDLALKIQVSITFLKVFNNVYLSKIFRLHHRSNQKLSHYFSVSTKSLCQ